MRIIVEEDTSLECTEVLFRTPRINTEVISAISRLKLYDKKITGFINGTTYVVPATDVLFFESVDKKTFFYTAEKIFETPMRLYEIEDQLHDYGFARTGKSIVVNLKEVENLRCDVGGRLLATLSNGEKTIISRAYSAEVKRLLGL